MAYNFEVFYGLMTAFAIASVLLNLLAVVVIARTPKLRSKHYAFVYNLVLADIGLGAVTMVGSPMQDLSNVVITGLFGICSIANVLTVFAVAINRYLAVSLMPPSRYDAVVTPVRLFIVCVLIWLMAFGFMLVMWIEGVKPLEIQYHTLISLVRPIAEIVIWTITSVLYIVVFHKIKRFAPPLATSPPVDSKAQSNLVNDTRYRQMRRLLVTFAIITVTSLICWIPVDANILYNYFNRGNPVNLRWANFYYFTAFVYTLNPLFDPIIYWWRLEEFREALCNCFRKDRSNEAREGIEHTVTETELNVKATNDAKDEV